VFADAVPVPEEGVAGFDGVTAGDGVTVCCVGCWGVFCVAWDMPAIGVASRIMVSVEQKRFI